MLNNLRTLVLVLLATVATAAHAQPQWRFHLAFEDGTGAKDTLWFIWDEAATVGSFTFPVVDYDLGEGGIAMDPNTFNVFLGNWDGDSTKTLAYPYSVFPWHGEQPIDAFNYEYPITIRWDRSLFHADFLPDPEAINTAVMNGQYFYWHGNMPFPGVHSLLEDDSVVVGLDASWAPLFPLTLTITHMVGHPDGMGEMEGPMVHWASDGVRLWIQAAPEAERIEVLDPSGRYMAGVDVQGSMVDLPVGHWSPGVYVIRVRTNHHTHHHAKFLLAR